MKQSRRNCQTFEHSGLFPLNRFCEARTKSPLETFSRGEREAEAKPTKNCLFRCGRLDPSTVIHVHESVTCYVR